jgi:glycosyltransferase involved in cell wall biosynthesis
LEHDNGAAHETDADISANADMASPAGLNAPRPAFVWTQARQCIETAGAALRVGKAHRWRAFDKWPLKVYEGMKELTITVLIDTYNYGQFIGEAIESVLGQDFPADRMQILIVDDGSTDDTREQVSKYADRVEYLYKPNGGQASAFNVGIQKARGEIVALLDADDYWLPSKVRRVVEEFDRHADVGLVYHPFREFKSETGEWRDGGFNAVSGFVPADRKKILLYTACQTSGLSFRKRFVSELLPLNEAMTIQADGLLAALVIFLAPVVAIPEPLAVYRIHGANLYFQGSKNIDKKRQARRIATLKVILEEMDKWLRERGHDLERPETSAFRKRWRLLYESEEFHLEPPGRLRFFLHLLRAMSTMNPCLNSRIQAVNLLNAVGSLVFGYENYAQLDEWRLQLKRTLARPGRSIE